MEKAKTYSTIRVLLHLVDEMLYNTPSITLPSMIRVPFGLPSSEAIFAIQNVQKGSGAYSTDRELGNKEAL